jgi:hypothetical protein
MHAVHSIFYLLHLNAAAAKTVWKGARHDELQEIFALSGHGERPKVCEIRNA